MKMDERYKLFSLDARGRSELIRLIFHAAGKEFEEIRVHRVLWEELKWGKFWLTGSVVGNFIEILV